MEQFSCETTKILWQLFKIAVEEKSPMQFAYHNLMVAVQNSDNIIENEDDNLDLSQ